MQQRARHGFGRRMGVGAFLLPFLLAAPATARAQNGAANVTDERATAESAAAEGIDAPWRIGFFVGAARNSPVTTLGITPGRDHLFVGISAYKPILDLGPLRLRYGAQILPMVLVRGRSTVLIASREGGFVASSLDPRDEAYAWGIVPFGLELGLRMFSRLEFFGATAAGGLIFDRPYPVPEGRPVNFTLEAGGGVNLRLSQRVWIQGGYKYHHLSNAYTTVVNPGLDANVFYAGIHRSTGRLR